PRSWLVAVASCAGLSHTGWLNRNTSSVGLADDCGKYLVSCACPAAESLPGGGVVLPPKPPALYPVTPTASAPKNTSPMSSVGIGCLTIRPATEPHTPVFHAPWMSQGSSFGLPNIDLNSVRLTPSSDSLIDSSAGSSVSAATTVTPSAIANGMPRS